MTGAEMININFVIWLVAGILAIVVILNVLRRGIKIFGLGRRHVKQKIFLSCENSESQYN